MTTRKLIHKIEIEPGIYEIRYSCGLIRRNTGRERTYGTLEGCKTSYNANKNNDKIYIITPKT